MDEIEQALSGLPEESPPPEIVLAAVRAFRYRAIAIVASILAGALLLAAALQSIGPDNLGEEAAALRNPVTVPILTEAGWDGVQVTATEMVWQDGTGYVRFVVEDTGSHAAVTIEPIAAVTSSGKRIELGPNPVLYVENYTTVDGVRIDRRTDGGWIKLSDQEHDPHGRILFELAVIEEPLNVVLYGGEITGPYPILTIEYHGRDVP